VTTVLGIAVCVLPVFLFLGALLLIDTQLTRCGIPSVAAGGPPQPW
jgi:hypothetical protein